MKQFIEVDMLIKYITSALKTQSHLFRSNVNINMLTQWMIDPLKNYTTQEDLVEVIRCKDCLNYEENCYCKKLKTYMDDTNYCKYGERVK